MSSKDKFQAWSVYLPEPKWGSDLASKVFELEKLRELRFVPYSFDLFHELKDIFHQLENWASARIEGNQTELIDALDPDVRPEVSRTVDYNELQNLRRAIKFIDDYCEKNTQITLPFILEVHKMVTRDLPIGNNHPGDETPGKFRTKNVKINKSSHVPPPGLKVQEYMDELMSFLRNKDPKQYYLLKMAVMHHRFTWVHPFNNGNGRVVRLLTYAELQLLGYGKTKWRIINPTAVFYADRQRYYDNLNDADKGKQAGVLAWADYFIGGLIEETNKIDRLFDRNYVANNLLMPVLKNARDSGRISDREYAILKGSIASEDMTFASKDINNYLGANLSPVTRTRIINSMRKSGLIRQAWDAKQRYVIHLQNSIFIRDIILALDEQGFLRTKE